MEDSTSGSSDGYVDSGLSSDTNLTLTDSMSSFKDGKKSGASLGTLGVLGSEEKTGSEELGFYNPRSSVLVSKSPCGSSPEVDTESPLTEEEKVLTRLPRKRLETKRGNNLVGRLGTSFGVRFRQAEPEQPCGSSEAESYYGVSKMGRKEWAEVKKRLLASRATRSQWSIDKEMTETSVDRLIELRWKYRIPDSVELRLIADDELPSSPPSGYVTLYPAMLAIGVRVPLQPPVQEWVSEFGVAPAQINPNGYRVILALIALWREKFDCDPPVKVLRHHLKLKENVSTIKDPIKGFYCVTPQRPPIVIGLPSPTKSWRNKWFFAKGWEATLDGGAPVPNIVSYFRDAEKLPRRSLLGVVKQQFDTLLALSEEERHLGTILTEKRLEILGIAIPGRDMTLDKHDPGLRARILQHRQSIKGPIVPKPLVLAVEATHLPNPLGPKGRVRQLRDDSPPRLRRGSGSSSLDQSEKLSGKKKVREEDQETWSPLRKKLRADDQPEKLMSEARKSWQAKPKLRVGGRPVKHRQLEVPEFLTDYVEDMLGFVDLKAHAGNFVEGELEGELDVLVKGAKSSMMLAGLKNHIVINKMAERIKELDSEAAATGKELNAMKDQMTLRKKDLVKERQSLVECKKKLDGNEVEKGRLIDRVTELEKDIEAKIKECQRESRKKRALDVEVEELRARVHASKNKILREFQNSQEYKDVLEVNYSEGYTDMLNMCIDHFGEKEMEWAIPSETGFVVSKNKGGSPDLNPTGEVLGVTHPKIDVQGEDLSVEAERIAALDDEPQEDVFEGIDVDGVVPVEIGGSKVGNVTPDTEGNKVEQVSVLGDEGNASKDDS